MYVYMQTNPSLWTVGFFDPNGDWYPDSEYDCKEDAAKRTALLNGSNYYCITEHKIEEILVNLKANKKTVSIPKKATEHSIGYDVYASNIVKISDDCFMVETGISLEFNEQFAMLLCPRSSIVKTHWIIQNSPGIGDPDYRGEYKFVFRALPIGIKFNWNLRKPFSLSYPKFPYKIGDRIGQIFFVKKTDVSFMMVNELSTTNRGTGGYGSTGTN